MSNETTTAVTITRHLPKKLDAYRKNALADEVTHYSKKKVVVLKP